MPLVEAKAILDLAFDEGIRTLDTAIGYGTSEANLGVLGVESAQIITKLPPLPENLSIKISCWCSSQINESLNRLKLQKVYGLLLHQPTQLLEKGGLELYAGLKRAKEAGLVKKIGVSIYQPRDLERLCDKFEFDLIQLPFNILDNRWALWLKELHRRGIEVHVRSIFLQGLLLMSKENRPTKFQEWSFLWKEWENWLGRENLTPLEACLNHALSKTEIDKVVIGVDSEKQLRQILAAKKNKLIRAPSSIQTNDPDLLNPVNWKKL